MLVPFVHWEKNVSLSQVIPKSAPLVFPLSISPVLQIWHLRLFLETFFSWFIFLVLPLTTSETKPFVSIFGANALLQVTFISEKPKWLLLGVPRSPRPTPSTLLKAREHSQAAGSGPGSPWDSPTPGPGRVSASPIPPGIKPWNLVSQG